MLDHSGGSVPVSHRTSLSTDPSMWAGSIDDGRGADGRPVLPRGAGGPEFPAAGGAAVA
jgi:hypothetical protein